MTTIRKGQVRLGPRTWAVIREAYLKGASAASLAETYGCSVGTVRYRAVREGWRRCDVEGFEPARAAPVAPAADELAQAGDEAAMPQELKETAMGRAARALRAGRPSEAAAYLRVAEALGRITAADADEPPQMSQEELEARAERLRQTGQLVVALLDAQSEERRERMARGEG